MLEEEIENMLPGTHVAVDNEVYKQLLGFDLINDDYYERNHNVVEHLAIMSTLWENTRKGCTCVVPDPPQDDQLQIPRTHCATTECLMRLQNAECGEDCPGQCSNTPLTYPDNLKYDFRLRKRGRSGMVLTCSQPLKKDQFVIRVNGFVKHEIEVEDVPQSEKFKFKGTRYVLDTSKAGNVSKFIKTTDRQANLKPVSIHGRNGFAILLIATRDIGANVPLKLGEDDSEDVLPPQMTAAGQRIELDCPLTLTVWINQDGIIQPVTEQEVLDQLEREKEQLEQYSAVIPTGGDANDLLGISWSPEVDNGNQSPLYEPMDLTCGGQSPPPPPPQQRPQHGSNPPSPLTVRNATPPHFPLTCSPRASPTPQQGQQYHHAQSPSHQAPAPVVSRCPTPTTLQQQRVPTPRLSPASDSSGGCGQAAPARKSPASCSGSSWSSSSAGSSNQNGQAQQQQQQPSPPTKRVTRSCVRQGATNPYQTPVSNQQFPLPQRPQAKKPVARKLRSTDKTPATTSEPRTTRSAAAAAVPSTSRGTAPVGRTSSKRALPSPKVHKKNNSKKPRTRNRPTEYTKETKPRVPTFLNVTENSTLDAAKRAIQRLFANEHRLTQRQIHMLRPREPLPDGHRCRRYNTRYVAGTLWTCCYCEEAFDDHHKIESHLIGEHRPDWRWDCICTDCQQTFKATRILKTHVKKKHPDMDEYICERCEEVFATVELYVKHNCDED